MKTTKHNLYNLVGKRLLTGSNHKNMINLLITTLVRLTHNKALRVVVLSICCLPIAGYANAHCVCKLGPPSSPIKDFGQIATYNTQIGHDSSCSSLCSATIDSYMNQPGNHTSACSAANGASIVTYSAVGTHAYQAGKTYSCPQTNQVPVPGLIVFGGAPVYSRIVHVNGVGLNPYAPPASLIVPIQTPFTTFTLDDKVGFHLQQWTYDATLYRDNVLIEKFSKRSPTGYTGSVDVRFTGQPNSAVHGHAWKIEWHYSGGGFSNGSVSFVIP